MSLLGISRYICNGLGLVRFLLHFAGKQPKQPIRLSTPYPKSQQKTKQTVGRGAPNTTQDHRRQHPGGLPIFPLTDCQDSCAWVWQSSVFGVLDYPKWIQMTNILERLETTNQIRTIFIFLWGFSSKCWKLVSLELFWMILEVSNYLLGYKGSPGLVLLSTSSISPFRRL